MSIRCYTGPSPSAEGFTLIEVIGALLIFSSGVLMVMMFAATLSLQMDRAALRSELAVAGQERLDSLELVSYAALTVGTTTSSTSIRGESYSWSITVSDSTALIKHAKVTATPVTYPLLRYHLLC